MKNSVSYHGYLIESLKDPEEAAGYLNAALEDGDITVFLLALNNVIQARGGITRLAEKIHKSRTSLYKALSKKGNPYLKNTNEILSAIGMHLSIMPEKADGNTHHTNLQ
jgi:probable addiction module antidote protein